MKNYRIILLSAVALAHINILIAGEDHEREIKSLKERLNRVMLENIKLKSKIRKLESQLKRARNSAVELTNNAAVPDNKSPQKCTLEKRESVSIKEILDYAQKYVAIENDHTITSINKHKKLSELREGVKNRDAVLTATLLDVMPNRNERFGKYGVKLRYTSKANIKTRRDKKPVPILTINIFGFSNDSKFAELKKGQAVTIKIHGAMESFQMNSSGKVFFVSFRFVKISIM